MDAEKLKHIIEAALLAAGEPLSVDNLLNLFPDTELPARDAVRGALKELAEEYDGRGVELKETAGGFRIQTRAEYSEWVSRLWEERPPRYSRALLETLALIAYRQPITRGEIEEIRGVSVSSNIMKALLEREWVRLLGHRDVPGRPAMYGTTRQFLDYFNLKSLNELPTLAEIRDIDSINAELLFEEPQADGERELGEAVEVPPEVGEESDIEADSEVESEEASTSEPQAS